MSSFSNGNYVPSGMDFADWVEYLDAKRDALIDEELEEFYNELFEPKEEEEFKLSLPEEHLSSLKHEADKFIDGVKASLSDMTKSGKLESLAEMQRETRERLLFIPDNDSFTPSINLSASCLRNDKCSSGRESLNSSSFSGSKSSL